MKRVLYVSNIEVPYRNEFFNQLSQNCELTVLYERNKSKNRNEDWAKSVKADYNVLYLKGILIKNEFSFDLRILKYIFSKRFDKIILGCINSPVQMVAVLMLRLFRKEYILNIDGEYYIDGKTLKQKIKRFFLRGASRYLVAGDTVKQNLSKYIDRKRISTYYFSSLNHDEVINNARKLNKNKNNTILVVGQYFDYKGIDTAIEAAYYDQSIKYEFIGCGDRSTLLKKKIEKLQLNNVEIIPFLSKADLYKKYETSEMLLLPSKKECWGLVINEAASFGCPIVSTYGSGAAVEFLQEKYKEFLCNPNDSKGMLDTIMRYHKKSERYINKYKKYLIDKSNEYYIEKSVSVFTKVIEER